MTEFGSEKTPRNIIVGVVIVIGISMLLSWYARRKQGEK